MRRAFTTLILLFLMWTQSASAIINGDDAVHPLADSTVFIHLQGADMSCTGVVIHRNLILTAAHCTEGAAATARSVTISNQSSSENGRVRLKLKTWLLAPGFSHAGAHTANRSLDLAFLQTDEDLLRRLRIHESRLPRLEASLEDLDWGSAIAFGYGIADGRYPERDGIKRQLAMEAELADAGLYVSARSTERGKGPCRGDSGGGLFSSTGVLLGILSGYFAGASCGSFNQVALYAPVSRQLCWIQKQSGIDLHSRCAESAPLSR